MSEECKEIIEVAEGPSVCAPSEGEPERQETAYAYKVRVSMPYEEALSAARHALAEQGLDIITEIDVRAYLASKGSRRFPHYTILGVCSAEIIHQALDLDRDSGLVIPCKMVVYEQSGGTIVEALDPTVSFSIADGSELQDLAAEIKLKLQNVVDRVAAGE